MPPVAPSPPFASSADRLPAFARQARLRGLSRLASPRLLVRKDALKAVAVTPGVIVIALRRTATPLQVEGWFPAGTEVNWGEGTPETAASDGMLQKTYPAPGTYQISATNVALKRTGSGLVTV